MSDFHQKCIGMIMTFFVESGHTLSQDDINILNLGSDKWGNYIGKLTQFYKTINSGFFSCAAKGVPLTDISFIEHKFGFSLDKNYPNASNSFLKFATTYWTFKIVLDSGNTNDYNWIGAQILVKLENEIASVFFPTPGPVKIPKLFRKSMQKSLIKSSGANIDIKDFFRRNPYL